MFGEGVALQWVVVDDEIQHVSDYAHLKAEHRPAALCPVCRTPVRMKLGQQRAHHAAHQPNAVCAVTQPETALHLNTKLYIARQLRTVSKLLIQNECAGNYLCGATCHESWVSNWNRVEVEVMVGSRKPDVALYKDELPIAVIEVRVTHAVDEEKAAYLNENGVPWIEIEATEDFYSGENVWTAAQPIPFIAIHPEPEPWVCSSCLKRAEQDRRKEENKWHKRVCLGIAIDFFCPDGIVFRQFYTIMELSQTKGSCFYSLENEEKERIAKHNAPRESAIESLKTACRNYVRSHSPKGTKHDSPSGWIALETDRQLSRLTIVRVPPKYQWDEQKQEWKERISFIEGVKLERPEDWGMIAVNCYDCGQAVIKRGHYVEEMNVWLCPDCAEKHL